MAAAVTRSRLVAIVVRFGKRGQRWRKRVKREGAKGKGGRSEQRAADNGQ